MTGGFLNEEISFTFFAGCPDLERTGISQTV
jgi:hypothetical protein